MTPPPGLLIYSQRFSAYSYGDFHPFKVQRYRMTFELMRALRLCDPPQVQMRECPLAREEELLRFHRGDYLTALAGFNGSGCGGADFYFGLGDVENPVFEGVYDWARLACGGTLEAVRRVNDGSCRLAFNMAGGWHHAQAARAAGFSYLNDAVVAIKELVRRRKRVAYVDLDAHHGDGVQNAFYDSNRVLTISIHETGRDFFPQTGMVREMGRGKGYGYAVNVPLLPHSDDVILEQALRRVVLPLVTAFKPDLLITQMGADCLRTDPLTRLEGTTGFFELAARSFLRTGLPWVILGGGGYDWLNVARAWSLVWGTALEVPLPDELPEAFQDLLAEQGIRAYRLRDLPHTALPSDFYPAQQSFEKVLEFLERKLFPLHGLQPGEGL
ncbi:MAG: acetoin utilization protein AcuC [Deltaproteobacteria bacterium]|nr:acetoin utilization protein AcuC [Deltaproteobacteria bacterium]